MALIMELKRLLRLPNRFVYTMLPSKDDVAVHATHLDHEEGQNADETPESPRYRPWSRQT
jgi:hypothetical protein